MKAAVLHGPHDLRLEDVDDPEISDQELLIKVKASGVCGTDIDMYEGTSKEAGYPFVPGHEWSGEVVEVGANVKGFREHDRVVGECVEECGWCHICKQGLGAVFCSNYTAFGFSEKNPGAMAEYLKAREKRIHSLPSNITFEEGTLVEPLSVAYHGMWGMGGGVGTHDNVVIFGGGPIGLLAVAVAKTAGASVVLVEPVEYRSTIGKELGADFVIDPTLEDPVREILHHTEQLGANLIVEASGSDQAIRSLMDAAATSGRIVLIGHSIGREIPIEIGKAIWKRLTIVGACDSPHFFPKTLKFMSRMQIDITPIITHRFPLTQVTKAFDLGLRRTESSKILVKP